MSVFGKLGDPILKADVAVIEFPPIMILDV